MPITGKSSKTPGWMFLVIGLVILFFGWRNLRSARRTETWPSTAGVVTSSEAVSSTSKDRRGKSRTEYSARVHYTYEVDAKKLKGSTISRKITSSSSSNVRAIVQQYPVGDEVRVFYSPEDPTQCVLQKGASWLNYFFPSIGLTIVLGSIGAYIYGHVTGTKIEI